VIAWYPKVIVAIALLATPLLAGLAIRAQTNTDDVNNWIDRASPEYAWYENDIRHFGSDDEIIISWDGCSVDDPRVPEAASRLRRDCGPWINRIVTGPTALAGLRRSGAGFSGQSARRRLRGSLLGDDLETTCLVARLSAEGRDRLDDVVARLDETLGSLPGIDARDLHYGGKAITDHALNSLTNRSLVWGIPGALLAALIALGCVRNAVLTIGMIFVASLAALASLAAVPLAGVQVNGLLVLMPVLVFVLTLGCAVHMVSSLQRQLDADVTPAANRDAVVRYTLLQSLPPVVLSMTTTAIGIGSLAWSPLPAVYQFGWFSAGSLLLAMLLLVFLLPAVWHCLGTGQPIRRHPGHRAGLVNRLIAINRHPALAGGAFAMATIPALVGIGRFETDLHPGNLFGRGTDYRQDRRWIEKHLFPLGRVDFVISFPRKLASNRFQQLKYVQRIQASFRRDEHYHSAYSAANLIPVKPIRSPLQRQLTRQLVATQIDHDYRRLNEQGLLYSEEAGDQWRISVSCAINETHDEKAHADRLLELARQSLQQVNAVRLPDVTYGDSSPLALDASQIGIRYSGMGPLAASGQRRLFQDLIRGLLTALLLITPLIMISMQSVRAGLTALIPNLFPIVMVFGYFGLAGWKLDTGAVLTATVGLGIAVDDTVHFLHYYRRAGRRSSVDLVAASPSPVPQGTAVHEAIRCCARPILTTSLIVCGGLFFFSFSQFLPVRNFAICLILMMIAAAVADLVLLPCLLTGPFRRFTDPGGGRRVARSPTAGTASAAVPPEANAAMDTRNPPQPRIHAAPVSKTGSDRPSSPRDGCRRRTS
jgi:predicted RND superfamily exporter protein